MRSIHYFMLLFCACKIISTSGVPVPECQDADYGRVCSLHAPVETVSVLDDRILVGSTDGLFSFTLGLYSSSQVDLSPATSTYEHCTGFEPGQFGFKPDSCRNFIKLIQAIPNRESILVCGSNAYRPKCTVHTISNLSDYEFMTEPDHIDVGYSPYTNKSEIVATLTSTGRFFSGTRFNFFTESNTIKMALNPLETDSEFNIEVPVSNRRWLQTPNFVSSYETENYIYFFLREQAYEIDEVEDVVYSRVVRICKKDNGTSVDSEDTNSHFSTFQKARIMCSSRSDSDSLPYAYNNLQSTFIWKEPTGERYLYGIFTSPENGPSGSAICRFSFDPDTDGSLTNVLDNGAFLVPSTGNPVTWSVMFTDPVTCSSDARVSTDASMYALAYNPATPIDPQPLHTVIGKMLDRIAIDVIVNYNGENQTIIFFSTMNGEIYQLVKSESQQQEVLIKTVGKQLGHMTIQKNANETRSLIVTTENQLMIISLGDCTRYSDCFACLDSSDVYCGWDSDAGKCVNKVASNSTNVLQSVLSTEDEIIGVCGPRPDSTPPTSNCDTTEENNTPNIGGILSNMVSVPDLVGATVGAFVVGIPVGAFVCFLLLKLFIAPRRRKHKRSNQGQNSTVIAANNLTQNAQQIAQKKEIPIKENTRYVDHTPSASQPDLLYEKKIILEPPPLGSAHKRKNSKDINTMPLEKSDIIDEPDHLPPLRSISSASLHSYGKRNGYAYNGVQRKQVPGYRVPRGRTESTTWLRANSVSSEPPSPFTPSPFTPLDSPISDV